MKLINLDHSPYATRVRIQIRKRGLPVEIIPPILPLRTPEFLKAHPMGKIPLLQLDDGQSYLPESVAIMEFLEDSFSDNPLRPDDPVASAKMRALTSFADTHLGPALLPFFKGLLIPEFSFDKQQQFDLLNDVLDKLDRWLAADDGLQRDLHLGDICMAPTLWYVPALMPVFGLTDPVGKYATLQAWWTRLNNDPHIKEGLDEMATAFNSFMQAASNK